MNSCILLIEGKDIKYNIHELNTIPFNIAMFFQHMTMSYCNTTIVVILAIYNRI